MNDINNIHDKIIKETFSRPELAKEYFRQYLPDQLKQVIDVNSMTVENGSYLTEDLKEYFVDLLFQFKLRDNRKKLIVSLIFEHKMNPDKHVLIQVGHYIFNQWTKELKSRRKLKPIIPLIYYQGKKSWQVPKIWQLFESYPAEIKPYLPDFEFIYFALNALSKAQLDNVTDAMLMIALMGHDPNVDIRTLMTKLKNINSLKQLDHLDRNFIKLIFVYKITTTDADKKDVASMVKSLPEPLNQEIMSTYEAIKLEGKLEGIIEGELKGKTDIIFSLSDDGFDVPHIARIVKMTIDEVQNILKSRKV